MAFPVEDIPDDAILFRKVHRNHFPGGRVSSVAFKDQRMSVNWEKFRNAESSADNNSAVVVALLAGKCRELQQIVEHTPIEPEEDFGPNQAHVEVCGHKTGALGAKLRDCAEIVWRRPA